jgi:hypothetical protein
MSEGLKDFAGVDTDKPSTVAPGMTMPVVAGEEYTLKDTKGEALVIEGRDDPLTIAFAQAFQNYLDVRAVWATDAPQCVGAWQVCMDAFCALPERVTRQFKSNLGITLPTRPL